jgi:hypothetical protein
MPFDRTRGQEKLERPPEKPAARPGAVAGRFPGAYVAAVIQAVASPIHGCCEEGLAEEYERWDGMD